MLWHVMMCNVLSHCGGGGDGLKLECLLTLQDQRIGTQDRCQGEFKHTITEESTMGKCDLAPLGRTWDLFQEKWILKQAVEVH